MEILRIFKKSRNKGNTTDPDKREPIYHTKIAELHYDGEFSREQLREVDRLTQGLNIKELEIETIKK